MKELYREVLIILRGMWKHRRWGMAAAWITGLACLIGIALLQERYEASARIFVNTDSILKPLMTGLTVQPNEDQRIVMLSRMVISRPNVEKLVQGAGLDTEARTQSQREAIVDGVMKTLQLKGAGKDNLFTLTFRDADPSRAKQAIEILASMFMDSSRGGKAQDTLAAKKFIDEQIGVYEKKLQESETRLKDFRVRHFGMAPGEGKDFFARMTETERELQQARLQLREAEMSRDALRRGLASAEAPVIGSGGQVIVTNPELDARIDAMRRNLDSMLLKYTDSHPDVVGAKRVLRELEQQRRDTSTTATRPAIAAPTVEGPRASETLRVSLAQAEAAVASLSARVAEFSARHEKMRASAAMVPQLEAELAQLNRDYEVLKKNYESLVSRREAANISGEMQTVAGLGDFRLVDPPRVSPKPVWPNRRLLIPLGLLLSIIVGMAAAYVAHELWPSFHDSRSVREVSGLPLLGVVSRVENDESRRQSRRTMLRFAGALGGLVFVFLFGLVAVAVMGNTLA